MFNRRFKTADLAQQVVGGFLLAGPFVVTEEVWSLARAMSWFQTAFLVFVVFAIGWGALFRADEDREVEKEAEIAGVPTRFITLILVSYGSVVVLALAFGAPQTFGVTPLETARAVAIGTIFSVVGAATADSVF